MHKLVRLLLDEMHKTGESIRDVARDTEISSSTVHRLISGDQAGVSYETYRKLKMFLMKRGYKIND